MKTISIVLFCVLVMTSSVLPAKMCVAAQEAKWKQIIVLQSTREDVERLFGKSKYQGYSTAYELEDGHLDIEYSGFNFCEHGQEGGWNVSEWTVEEVTYHPNDSPQFSSLKLDLAKFRKERESPGSPDFIDYINDAEGVAYVLYKPNGTLNNIRYFPSSQYNRLRCHKQPKETS